MATHTTRTLDEAALTVRPTAELGRLGGRSMMVGALGVVLSVLGLFAAPDIFWQSYLIAYVFWMGITVGSLAVLDDSALVWRRVGPRRAACARSINAHPAVDGAAVPADCLEGP